MGRIAREDGFGRAAVVLLVLIVVIGTFYLTRRRSPDVAEAGKTVADDLEQAAKTVRDTSEDALLTAKAKTALALSKSASAFDVDLDSDDGTVTVTGAVPSREDKEAVLNIVRDTAGVLEVVDRIDVDPEVVPGTQEDKLVERLRELEIESAAYEQLLRAEELDARWVRVWVDGRVVRLTGRIPTSSQRERASTVVASVPGVEKVLNDLDVSDSALSGRVLRREETPGDEKS